MANLNKINNLLKEKKRTKNWLANETGVSPQGIIDLIKKGNCAVSTLERIAAALEVPISTFFEEVPTIQANNSGIGNTQIIGSGQNTNTIGYCTSCVEKDKEIKELQNKIIKLQEKLLKL